LRRLGPRPLDAALDAVVRTAAPAGLLPRVQACWAEAAGGEVALEAQPVAERDGVVTVACSSSLWAHELELLAGDLLERLNSALGAAGGPSRLKGLRFEVGLARPP
jgi:predicted nucleic acid-binding Zn ribbon protein